jgi:agmatinase
VLDKRWKSQDSQKVARISSGPRTFLRLPFIDVQDVAHSEIDVGVIGVPTDWATGYRSGARFGPEGVRSASTLLRTGHPKFKMNIADTLRIADVGDAPVIPGYHERTLDLIEASLSLLHDRSITPLILGGDHSLAIAELRACNKKYGKVALIQFDAHRDVLDDYFGVKHFHGTVYRRAVDEELVIPEKSFQIGMRGSLPPEDLLPDDLGYNVWTWQSVCERGYQTLVSEIETLTRGLPVALSFDIDFLDPAFAPGTGTPEVGGPSTYEAMQLLQSLPPLNIVTASIVEIAPPYDPAGITSMAGAAVAFEILTNIARYKARHANGL